jgi:adenosine deaminase
VGYPPSKFERVFAKARKNGFLTFAHAGEEGPASYIWEALDLLKVSRIDHGNRCLDDNLLVDRLVSERMALTVCPLSNLSLCVIDTMADHPIPEMMKRNVLVTVNSDDPAYFGGYVNDNYRALYEALSLSDKELYLLVRNSFEASFLPENIKQEWMIKVDEMYNVVFNSV